MPAVAHDLRQALGTTLDNVAVNRAQRRELFNPDPDVNSLAEEIVALRAHGVPDTRIRALLAHIRRVLELNELEGNNTRTVASQLDDLARTLAHAERNQRIVAGESTKRIAAELRAHLRVLREQEKAPIKDGVAYFTARTAIDDIVARCPMSRLDSATMRRQLGDGPHRQLLQLAGEHR